MVKIALLEASHWHVPLYLDAFAGDDVELVAVSDTECARGRDIAARFSATCYDNAEALIENETFDFAFVFGRHCDMAGMGKQLVDRNIAFAIEKPGGLNAAEVADLKSRAAKTGLYVSVPFIFRFSDLLNSLNQMPTPQPARWQHMSFRFIAGPLQRYIDANCGWMLDRSLAAGGCMINLAVHFVDLVLTLTGDDIAMVTACTRPGLAPATVEIFSSMTLTTTGGVICNIETGYTYPGGTEKQREFSFTLASESHYIRSLDDGLHVTDRGTGNQQSRRIRLETDEYYPVFAAKTLTEFGMGKPPTVGLADLERVMTVIDCAYLSAGEAGRPVNCLTGALV